ncbi:MAG: type II toxin-antitoxin system VapC family toxin [Candidatus Limnocylindrales bacterium]
MKALIDTHVFLWWVLDADRLSVEGRELLGDRANDFFLSAASAAELAIKVGQGRLTLPEPVESYVPSRLGSEGFQSLPIELGHALRVARLPPIHRDPFDRILIAQAQIEDLPILTADPVIARYDVETIW